MYQSTKVIDGFSTCFRQWRATSHCNKLHGYALKFKVTFQATSLDANNWVMDFGFMKTSTFKFEGMQINDWFKSMFDHTLVLASDDPYLENFKQLEKLGVASVRTLDRVGCEAFAELVMVVLGLLIKHEKMEDRVSVLSVECIETEKNSAIIIK